MENPTRKDYDKRRLPTMVFTEAHTVADKVLYIEGEEYDPYNWNYSRMIDLLNRGILIIKT